MTTTYKGIDYGLGRSNRNSQTGIRFGVISQNELQSYWFDSCESDWFEDGKAPYPVYSVATGELVQPETT